MTRRTLHKPSAAQILAAFEASFVPEPNTGCWLWMGPALSKRGGYGVFSCGRFLMARAHRVAWELYCHPVGREHVLHRCDNPLCVNPDHLFLGDQAVNMRDKAMKGRQQEGAANPSYKHGRYVGDKKNPQYPPGIGAGVSPT